MGDDGAIAARPQSRETYARKRSFLQIREFQKHPTFIGDRQEKKIVLLDQSDKMFIREVFACEIKWEVIGILTQAGKKSGERSTERCGRIIEDPLVDVGCNDGAGETKRFQIRNRAPRIFKRLHSVIDPRQKMAMEVKTKLSGCAPSLQGTIVVE